MAFLLENDIIGLREAEPSELDWLMMWGEHPDNRPFVLPYDRPRWEQALHAPDELLVMIVQKATGQAVGFVLLAGLTNSHRALELRRVIIAEKGLGVGRQVIRLLKTYCFEILRFHRFWLDVYPFNERALHLYRTEGFQWEGTLRDSILRDGQYFSLHVFSMLATEYVL
ncbi:Protein N-acetyltransferase, RimJ/RimL family [Catalinimonas alkaloidigena]|uniref:Protein N-acetyltransferase, RimJ/RimL family n=1 Tax=Catalinimonas alkaloidigena TaxID=1075417 RepID=A0A1G9H741_9BACT|nr:GNAT family protein [Catalinimonas alkaloidigena]SDL08747.1 Protein N-acetyltransferase, RimJ/RimL family [Catalinimonas alkaloidigena]